MTEISERDRSRIQQRAQTTRYIDRMAELGRAQLQAARAETQALRPTDHREKTLPQDEERVRGTYAG